MLVPADPRVSHTWGKALQEHEQRHTIQGNYFGPFLGNFPLTGLVDLAGIDQPDWFKEVFNDETGFQGYEAISLAGLLFGAWKLFLAPAFVSKSARDAILSSNFQGWNRLFNPLWSYIISKLPDLDVHHSITGDGFFTGMFRFIARATDLRFWTPLLGFVPLWYPDSGRNTLEQDASRESGDLYTTILTTDDKFNAKLTSRLVDFLRDDHDADVEKPLGSVFRLMMYPADRWDRIFRFDTADQAVASLPVVYNDEGSDRDIVTITAPADTLFHPDLYRVAGAPAVPIEGPTSNPAPVDFLKLPAGASARPTLRNLVPLPPRINRTAGLYFIPAQPAAYECKAFDRDAGNADRDALTHTVKLTVSGDVTFGSDPVTWQPPTAHPGVPAAPAFDRFVTEVVPLTVKRGKDALATGGFEERKDVTGAAAPNLSLVKNAKDWTFTAGDTATTVRVRLFRIFKKNDAANDLNNDRAFDLTFPDVQTLKNVRSYLEKDLWIPLRDFIVNVQDLPALANVAKISDEFEDVELPLDVDAAAIAITPPAGAPAFPKPSRRGVGPTFARGRIWRFGPLGKTIEDPFVYRVEVTFGKPPITVNRGFDLTINPIITLQRAGAGAFEATTGTPLELTINGGTAPYTLQTENKPAGTDVTSDFANLRITVTVNAAPPAPQQVIVIVKDSKGKEGRR